MQRLFGFVYGKNLAQMDQLYQDMFPKNMKINWYLNALNESKIAQEWPLYFEMDKWS